MKKLLKIRIFAFAKFQAILMMLVGLVAGVLYSFGGLIIDVLVSIGWLTTLETPGLSTGSILAFGALIGMPLIFGAAGYIIGICEAILYNWIAKWFGGIKADFDYHSG